MKTLFLTAFLLLRLGFASAQPLAVRASSDLPCIAISPGSSVHFRSPEPIAYADISDPRIKGDLPVKNVLRIKIPTDSVQNIDPGTDLGTLTVIGETFMAQYRLISASPGACGAAADIEILPEATVALDLQPQRMSEADMRAHAMDMLLLRGKKPLLKTSSQGITVSLNRVLCVGELIFMDLSFENSTALAYEPSSLSFTLEDRKINKATTSQSVAIKPLFSLYPAKRFSKVFRNIYVIGKLTYPPSKRLEVTLDEKQLSARKLSLSVKYRDLLTADTF
ncbi:hypothetical protein ASE74_04125 [Pedobacter sp. Leaf216]|uniref:DUF4138 domain-containing protein n=1 Tax=Pedobacter sp. Leaf216 TaxID=1735684 RepID=UPI0006F4873A|nr:DUF4138 domain-containing protein [Pedobacter sp. Leaf216]KQM69207.1 hypothetical protein ASE74_04125 [Pedobacter sp. Leaf216]